MGGWDGVTAHACRRAASSFPPLISPPWVIFSFLLLIFSEYIVFSFLFSPVFFFFRVLVAGGCGDVRFTLVCDLRRA